MSETIGTAIPDHRKAHDSDRIEELGIALWSRDGKSCDLSEERACDETLQYDTLRSAISWPAELRLLVTLDVAKPSRPMRTDFYQFGNQTARHADEPMALGQQAMKTDFNQSEIKQQGRERDRGAGGPAVSINQANSISGSKNASKNKGST